MVGPLTRAGGNPGACWGVRLRTPGGGGSWSCNPEWTLGGPQGPLGDHHRQLVNPLSLSEMQLMSSEWSGETHEPNLHPRDPGDQ